MIVHDEITDDLIFNNKLTKIAKTVGYMYGVTNYAILCDGKIVCSCGSDIVDADNIYIQLSKMYPKKEFSISDEFPSFD